MLLLVRRGQRTFALIVTCSMAMAQAIGPEQVLFSAVYFDRGRDVIDSSNELTLRVEWARPLLEHPEWTVVVHGQASEEGTAAEMLELSRGRAQAVVRALIGLGVDAKRLKVAAHGDAIPAVWEPGEDAKWNRRCDASVGMDPR